jgi:hypothetical protein
VFFYYPSFDTPLAPPAAAAAAEGREVEVGVDEEGGTAPYLNRGVDEEGEGVIEFNTLTSLLVGNGNGCAMMKFGDAMAMKWQGVSVPT